MASRGRGYRAVAEWSSTIPLGSTQDRETARPSGTSPSAPWEQPHSGRISLPDRLPEEETRLTSQAGPGSRSSGHRFPKGPSGKTSKIYPNWKLLCKRYEKPAKTQTQAGIQRAWVARQLRKSPPRARDGRAGLQAQAQGDGGRGHAELGLPGSHWPVQKLRAESFWIRGYFNIKMAVLAPGTPASLASGPGKRLSQPRKHTTGPGRTCQPPWSRRSSKTRAYSDGRRGAGAGARPAGGRGLVRAGGPTADAPAPPARGPPGAEKPPESPPPPPRPGFWFRPKQTPPGAAQGPCKIRPTPRGWPVI